MYDIINIIKAPAINIILKFIIHTFTKRNSIQRIQNSTFIIINQIKYESYYLYTIRCQHI